MHATFATAFVDEMRKLGALRDFSEFVVHDPAWVGEDLPAEPWTKRQEYAYRKTKKILKRDPHLMPAMFHQSRVDAMADALARPSTALAQFAESGGLPLSPTELMDIDPEMRRALRAGEQVRRRPEMLSLQIRPRGGFGTAASYGEKQGEKAISNARPLGLGEWLRSILTRRREAARAVRALIPR